MTREEKKQMDDRVDVYELKEPLKERFTEEGRDDEPLEPPEPFEELKEVEIQDFNDRRGNECVCPQCGKELQARIGADCSLEQCPECGLSLQPR
jgi:hypothetical protein